MTEIVLFGGTTEGRTLALLLQKKQYETLVCVASDYGESLLKPGPCLCVHAQPLNEDAMCRLLQETRPRLVLDATHPYADGVSKSIRTACQKTNLSYLRVLRQTATPADCLLFDDLPALIAFLNESEKVIFSTLGAKEAVALSAVHHAADRVWIRVLPRCESLEACANAGFPPSHIICMQGPFSTDLNRALFAETNAQILVTKETGAAGGFPEKVSAARELGMEVAVLRRPPETAGVTMAELTRRIEEDLL